MNGSGALTLQTAGRVLRAEGLAALRDRIADRVRESLRRRSFRATTDGRLGAAPIPVLNVLPTGPNPRLGGLQSQLLTRIEAEAARRSLALLYPEAEGYRLEVASGGRRLALALRGAPPSPVALRDEAFERAVEQAATEVGARALHVEGLSAIPLGSLSAVARFGLELVLSVHDFSLFCPRPHLLEEPAARFCGYSRDPQRCARCLAHAWPVGLGFQEERRALAHEVLRAARAVVYPSDFLRRHHLELFPGLPVERQHVIEPSVPGGAPHSGARNGPVRHVAYIGQVLPHKGARIFEEVLHRLPPADYPALRWSAYGGGDAGLLQRLRGFPRVRVRGYYRSGSLVDRLRKDQVDLALLLSIVPESYSLALSECRAAGVPVVAFDHGAIAERIRRQGGGLLVDPAAGAAGVAAAIAELAAGRREAPAAPPSAPAPPAAEAFQELYRELGLT